jgi:uncharacterized membrane protein
MTLHRLVPAALTVVASLVWATTPAHAELKLCNQTSYILYVATGSATKKQLDTKGWARIAPGDCATPIPSPLAAIAYFIYARTSRAHSGPMRAWGGNVLICARDTNFSEHIRLPVRGCRSSEFYKMPFALLDRHGLATWTTTFTETPTLKTLKEAKRAGINRLLTDLGYHVNGPGERARDQALEDFHRRTKLPADANDAELFATLEVQATKAASPAGYTVCNSSDQPMWIAIGMQMQKDIATRGWWQAPAGACSRVISEPLHANGVYLFARGKGKQPPIVTGPTTLCIRSTEFDLKSSQTCSGKGFSKVGFAFTDTRGRAGYMANIGQSGLLRPPPPVPKPGK